MECFLSNTVSEKILLKFKLWFYTAQMDPRIPARDFPYRLPTNCRFAAVVCWVLGLLLELRNVAALVIKWKETMVQ